MNYMLADGVRLAYRLDGPSDAPAAVIDRAAHLSNIEQPEAFTGLLLRFLVD